MRKRLNEHRTTLVTLLSSVCLLVSSASHAQSPSAVPNLQLTWPDVTGCPSRAEVERAILHHLGEATAHTTPILASVTIEPADGYRLILWMRNKSTQSIRALHGEDCRHVTDAAVVILAMLLADDGLAEMPLDAAPVAARPLTAPSGALPPTPSRVAPSLREFRLRDTRIARENSTRIGLGAWLPLGLAKAALFGAAVSGETERFGWRMGARIGWIPKTRIALPSDPSRGADVTVVSGSLSVGPVIARGSWAFVPRLGIAEQLLVGTGYGVDLPVSRSAYHASGRIGGLLEASISSQLLLQFALDASIPFQRPALLLEPGGAVLRPAHLGFDTALSLLLRI